MIINVKKTFSHQNFDYSKLKEIIFSSEVCYSLENIFDCFNITVCDYHCWFDWIRSFEDFDLNLVKKIMIRLEDSSIIKTSYYIKDKDLYGFLLMFKHKKL